MRISYEDAVFATDQLAHCVNHVLTVRIYSQTLQKVN
jgi:hypothetical protein